jgi:hypothetical protein
METGEGMAVVLQQEELVSFGVVPSSTNITSDTYKGREFSFLIEFKPCY